MAKPAVKYIVIKQKCGQSIKILNKHIKTLIFFLFISLAFLILFFIILLD